MHIFAGIFKGRNILAPKGLKTRPTSGRLREALFNICQGYHQERFLDLFAGSGAMGLEALSRGAQWVTFVDNSRESIRCLSANVRALGVEDKTEIIYGNVFEVLLKLSEREKPYDIIYADPPYDQMSHVDGEEFTYSSRILKMIDERKKDLLAPEGALFLEDAAGALPMIETLEHLELKNRRQMGRSALQYYVSRG